MLSDLRYSNERTKSLLNAVDILLDLCKVKCIPLTVPQL